MNWPASQPAMSPTINQPMIPPGSNDMVVPFCGVALRTGASRIQLNGETLQPLLTAASAPTADGCATQAAGHMRRWRGDVADAEPTGRHDSVTKGAGMVTTPSTAPRRVGDGGAAKRGHAGRP